MALQRRRTLRLRADVQGDVAEAARILTTGGTVAFPTETVYGLGANALDPAAVACIFQAKQRPAWDPLIVHISDVATLGRVATVSGELQARTEALVRAFWPGPLTMLLPRADAIPDAVTAGRGRVGVRVPALFVARDLIAQSGVPIAAPSANRFGHTSPTTAEHVLEDLDGRIDAVLDGGATTVGLESTVLDVCEQPMVIYRPGAVTPESIAAVAGQVESYHSAAAREASTPESLPSPGVGLRHYAPRARLVLVHDARELARACAELSATAAVGVMLPAGWDPLETLVRGLKSGVPDAIKHVYLWGAWNDLEQLARRVFAGLRELDAAGADVIVCPVPPSGLPLSAALADRLFKAARPH